jgi:hypothetical protein
MVDDTEYENDNEGWVEPDDFTCNKCGKPIEFEKWDGPFGYFDNVHAHGNICGRCGNQYCEDCVQFQTDDEGVLCCLNCYEEQEE